MDLSTGKVFLKESLTLPSPKGRGVGVRENITYYFNGGVTMLPNDVWEQVPVINASPDFTTLLAVLQRKTPARPTLFEFFLNDRLYWRLVPEGPLVEDGDLSWANFTVKAFRNAGYDYATFLPPGFDFPSDRVKIERTISINEGALITDRASFNSYSWPDPQAANYAMLDQIRLPTGMKLIGYSPDGVLENVIKLVGFERLCYLLLDDEKLVADIFEQVGARLLRYYELLSQPASVGACIGNDDWGFKTQTMLSPRDMRRFVFPWYQKIVQAVHAAGKPIILHSCGYFQRILADIADEMRFDARHSYEDVILPVEEAYEQYHHRFAVLGGIDVDFVCRSSPEAVYQRSKAMLARAAGRGGYALGTGNSVPDYVPDACYFAMTRAALAAR